jgi:hypothetical protein
MAASAISTNTYLGAVAARGSVVYQRCRLSTSHRGSK